VKVRGVVHLGTVRALGTGVLGELTTARDGAETRMYLPLASPLVWSRLRTIGDAQEFAALELSTQPVAAGCPPDGWQVIGA